MDECKPLLIGRAMEACTFATTVSPTYAIEIQNTGIIRENKKKMIGILNGIDMDVWQGLTLVHFSAQLKAVSAKYTHRPPHTPLAASKHPLNNSYAHPLSHRKRLRKPEEWTSVSPCRVGPGSGQLPARRQGLTLVHLSAQPEPFQIRNTPSPPPNTP